MLSSRSLQRLRHLSGDPLSQPEGSQARKEESGEKSPEAAPKTWRGVGEFQVRLPVE